MAGAALLGTGGVVLLLRRGVQASRGATLAAGFATFVLAPPIAASFVRRGSEPAGGGPGVRCRNAAERLEGAPPLFGPFKRPRHFVH